MSEKFDAIDDELLEAIAKVKGHAVQKAEPMPVDEIYPVSAAIRKAREDVFKNLTRDIPGEGGVFAGIWQPEGLSQKFNVIAAVEDLTDESGKKATFQYIHALRRLATLKDWHGHAGTNYATDKDLYKALRDGSYLKEGAGWFIPPRELLTGTEPDGSHGIREGKIIQTDNLYSLKDTGKLPGSFCTVASNSGYSVRYWSSTESREDRSCVWGADFSDGYESCSFKDGIRLSCRPVRLVPCP